MAMPAAPPWSTNSAASRKAGEPLEYIFGSCAAQPAGHNVNSRNSAEQPVDGKDPTGSVPLSRDAQQVGSASTLASSAEQLRCRSLNLLSIGTRAVPHEGGEKQPKKRCNHNLVKVDDVMMPEILQPIQRALAQEIDEFETECEEWDPPNIFEDPTEVDKPEFTPAQTSAVYAVIRGLLAVLHSDVHYSQCCS